MHREEVLSFENRSTAAEVWVGDILIPSFFKLCKAGIVILPAMAITITNDRLLSRFTVTHFAKVNTFEANSGPRC
jgi:hypothetical protein